MPFGSGSGGFDGFMSQAGPSCSSSFQHEDPAPAGLDGACHVTASFSTRGTGSFGTRGTVSFGGCSTVTDIDANMEEALHASGEARIAAEVRRRAFESESQASGTDGSSGVPPGFAGDENRRESTSFGSSATPYEYPSYHDADMQSVPATVPDMFNYGIGVEPWAMPGAAASNPWLAMAATHRAMAEQCERLAWASSANGVDMADLMFDGGYPCLPPFWQGSETPFTKEGRPRRAARHEARAPPKAEAAPETEKVTVMLRNLPNDYDRDMLLELLTSHGFGGCFDFVYLPIDFKKGANLGYAFINMVTHEDALNIHEKLSGYNGWALASSKVCEVAWGAPDHQGLQKHIERYRNSPVMHDEVPDKYRPMLFEDGKQIPFPAPTKTPRKPRIKTASRCRNEAEGSDGQEAS